MENKKEKNNKSEAALREEKILKFWKDNQTFEKSLKQTEGNKEFVFFEGPPTANGKPGIHHLEARAFKDAIPRYKTMRGYHVRRKGGWDTHGLPVEIQVEKKLGLDSKKAIEEYGIAKFNQKCKESVWEYVDVWNKFTERIGYWVDQEHPYVTYENNYMESVWNVLKTINDKGLLYKDYKVVPWCPRCGTVLSSHELAQGYEDVKDLSITAKFRLKAVPSEVEGKSPSINSGRVDTYLLAWTTTPWTLPGNVALAVGENIDYVEIKITKEYGDEILVLAKERLSIISEDYEIVAEHKGKEMVGMEYEPLFPFLKEIIPASEKEKLKKAYKVYSAGFVNTEDGTGIVHTAVMYGQDDFVLGTEIGLPKHHLVAPDGTFVKGTGYLEGRFVKETDANGKPTLTVDIIEDLKKRNLFFKQENYKHSYPHCWRCRTALIYYARDSWYIEMSRSKIKKKLINENKDINWEPIHIRDGRFGEWLREIKDWAISRERYWGTPLPLWQCAKCYKRHVMGGIADLKNKTKKSGNKYFVMRHGEAENNAVNVYSSDPKTNHLTEKGRAEVLETVKNIKNKKIAKIFCSPYLRTRETANIVAEQIGLSKDKIIYDDRIRELEFGVFSGRPAVEFWDYIKNNTWEFDTVIPEGESYQDAKNRIGDFLYEIDGKFKDETILIISHGLAVEMVPALIEGADKKRSLEIFHSLVTNKTASLHKQHEFIPLPHNTNYELDLHRPYIDEISLICDCGNNLTRTREVIDVWFDSGAMPFAQDHYPFSARGGSVFGGDNELQRILYPADFISEAIDQTRGWFYTLHAIGTLMGRGKAYKNVICLGHLMDANGKKMSKSLGNVIDPWEMLEKYGVDTLRLWMYSVNQPGESKNFDEKTVLELHRQVFGLLYNVLAFYELYRDRSLEPSAFDLKPSNILDVWILARLDELIELATQNLDSYKLLEPTRAIRDFISDLSTWYLRRSRERIKDTNTEDSKEAKTTLYFVLKTLAKVMAPFVPFTAEDIWLKLRNENDKESVHLEHWPTKKFKILWFIKPEVLEKMETVKDVVSLGLQARQKAGIKVRQPLNRLEVISEKLSNDYIDIIKDELNIKNIDCIIKVKIGLNKVSLDTNITEELKQEGDYRELARAIQDMRKSLGLTPSDIISITLETSEAGKNLIQKFESDLKKVVLASGIEFGGNDGEEIKIDGLVFKVKIEK